jgi:hypothetical protein
MHLLINMINQARLLLTAALATTATCAFAQYNSASTSVAPYVVPTASGWSTVSIATVNDATSIAAAGGYKMVGIPDGLGVYSSGANQLTVLMNHELGNTAGVARAHGAKGSFVSEWTLNTSNWTISSGADLIQDVFTWNTTTSSYNSDSAVAFARLCSADLAPVSAFSNGANGTTARLFLNGEETGNEGRAFAHIATGANKGQTYELPRLGKFSWENAVANPFSGNTTVVIGTDDSSPGQVYVYTGTKTATGNEIERAGLTNGSLAGIALTGVATESRANGINVTAGIQATETNSFTVFNHGNVENTTGSALNTSSNTNGVTSFLRPEDGVWIDSDSFVFATTDAVTASGGRSRLYQIDFNGTYTAGNISMLLDGTEGGEMFDNLTVSDDGTQIILQEDPGSDNRLAKIWSYSLGADTLTELAAHDADFFTTGAPAFLTTNEESSGVVDISGYVNDGYTYYLYDVQAHYGISGELVEGGQLAILTNNPGIASAIPEPSTYAAIAGVLGLGLAAYRRRRA